MLIKNVIPSDLEKSKTFNNKEFFETDYACFICRQARSRDIEVYFDLACLERSRKAQHRFYSFHTQSLPGRQAESRAQALTFGAKVKIPYLDSRFTKISYPEFSSGSSAQEHDFKIRVSFQSADRQKKGEKQF